LKGGKETSDLAEYFPPFKTQIGPKIKKIANDYFSASLLTATGSKLGYQNMWTPTSLQKRVRSKPKTGLFFTVNIPNNGSSFEQSLRKGLFQGYCRSSPQPGAFGLL